MTRDVIRVGVFDQIVSGGGVRFFTTKLLEEFSRLAGAKWHFHLMWPLFDSSNKYLLPLRRPNVSFERIGLDDVANRRSKLFPALRKLSPSKASFNSPLSKRIRDYEERIRRDEQRTLRALDGRGLQWLDQRSKEFDLLYLPYPYLTLPRNEEWQPRVPLVVTLHDLAHEKTDAWGDLTEPLQREVRRWMEISDLVIFSSDYIKTEAQKIYALPEERAKRIYLAPGGANDSPKESGALRHYALNKNYVLTLGWAAKHKRVETIIEGFARFKKESGMNDVALVIAGPDTENLSSANLHDLELGRDLFALGYVPDEDIPVLYQRASAVVTASISEAGLNSMIFDAMNYERAVICSNIPQFTERLGADGSLALTFEPFSPDALARALLHHFENPEAAQARVRRAKQFINSRSLKDVGRDYLAAFESVLRKRA